MREILRDHLTLCIVPGAGADAVTSVDGGLTGTRLGAELGAPGLASRACRGRQRLAMRIRSREPAEIGAMAHARTGDEEGHRRALRRRLRQCVERTGKKRKGGERSEFQPDHDILLICREPSKTEVKLP